MKASNTSHGIVGTPREEFLLKHPKRESIIRHYESVNGSFDSWDDITNKSIYSFVKRLKSKVSPNSARTYSAMFKSFLNLYLPILKNLTLGWERLLSIKEVESTFVVLDEEEVDKIIRYALDERTDRTEASVAATFATCCITGARWDDAHSFKNINLKNDTFKYISQKTDIIAEIPVSPILRKLVPLIYPVSLVYYNRIIRSICSELDIKGEETVFKGGVAYRGAKCDFVSSHTARRSFATNLYKRGADLEVISRMMGHVSYQQTKRYIHSSLDDLSENIKNFFNK